MDPKKALEKVQCSNCGKWKARKYLKTINGRLICPRCQKL